MNETYPSVSPLRLLKYHHSGSQMILRLPRNQAVNKTPSEDDKKPHWGVRTWKPIHNHSDRAKGSIICFPCSQKFMSDGLAIGAYPLPARFLLRSAGGVRAGNSSSFSYSHRWYVFYKTFAQNTAEEACV